MPDIMKEGGSKCIDCHVEGGKVVKPDNKVCLKCHDSGYDEMMDEWKADVKKLTAEVNELISSIDRNTLDDQQKAHLDEVKKNVSKISSFPSIYVHNNEMINTILSDGKEKLKGMK